MSSFVLDSYQELLRNHLVVTLFLTMLVGAGGNAGNQSAIKVIRGLVSIFLALKLGLHVCFCSHGLGRCMKTRILLQSQCWVVPACWKCELYSLDHARCHS